VPLLDMKFDWRQIPDAIRTAGFLHDRRLQALYFDPADPNAQSEISVEEAQNAIALADSRLKIEQGKRYQDLTDEEKADLQWFFVASRDPQLRTFIFSEQSLAKQDELKKDRASWFRWLRNTVEEMQREAYEMVQPELERPKPEEDEQFADKWKLKIKVKSWSHSIRANQLNEWNNHIEKIKLFRGGDHRELIVEFTFPRMIMAQNLWNTAMQNCVMFVSSLNIASLGFFWWYLPTFVSRFDDGIKDLDTNTEVTIERSPALMIGRPRQALKAEEIERSLNVVYGLVMRARDEKLAVYHRYFGALGLMAKNDIFGQFEHNVVREMVECLKMALKAYGDWDGDEAKLASVVETFAAGTKNHAGLVEVAREALKIAAEVNAQHLSRTITLEDAVKSKMLFDAYISIKAREFYRQELVKRTGQDPSHFANAAH
jgi:hypothetical protein